MADMELETISMCAAGAADGTIGVNTMIDALTINAGHLRPAHVTIYNSVDHGWVARRAVPEDGGGVTFPALAVLVAEPITLDEVQSVVRDGHFPVGFAYLQKLSDSAKGNRDALYTSRAVLRFLSRFANNAAAVSRAMNGIQIVCPVDTKQPPVSEPWGGALVTAVTVVKWLVRETAP
jgi:hypothetical protein